MSIPVPITEIAAQLAEYPSAYLLSVDPSNAPRANSIAAVASVDGTLRFNVGRRTAENLSTNGRATVLCPAVNVGGLALLIDGTVVVDAAGAVATLTPTWAVLHQTVRSDG